MEMASQCHRILSTSPNWFIRPNHAQKKDCAPGKRSRVNGLHPFMGNRCKVWFRGDNANQDGVSAWVISMERDDRNLPLKVSLAVLYDR